MGGVVSLSIADTLHQVVAVDFSIRAGHCHLACAYCPQASITKAYGKLSDEVNMSVESFVRMLAKVPPQARIIFAGFADIWLNPNCMDMIQLASATGLEVEIYHTLKYMGMRDLERLRSIKLRRHLVHLPCDNGLMNVDVDDEYIRKLHILQDHFDASFIRIGNRPLHPLVSRHLSKPCNAELPNNRAGELPKYGVYKPLHGPIGCGCRPGRPPLLVLPNGDTSFCSVDWSLKHIIGNLLHQEFDEVAYGEKYQEIVAKQRSDDGEVMCRSCQRAVLLRTEDLPAGGDVETVAGKFWKLSYDDPCNEDFRSKNPQPHRLATGGQFVYRVLPKLEILTPPDPASLSEVRGTPGKMLRPGYSSRTEYTPE